MKRNLTLFLTLLLQATLLAQNGNRAFNLPQALEFAMKNGYTVTNAATDIEIAQKKVTELRGSGIPQLSAEASFQNFIRVPVSVIPAGAFDPSAPPGTYLRLPFGIKYNVAYGYTASWLLFNGEYLVGLQAAKTYVEYSRNNLRKSEIEVKEGVTRAYHLVLTLKENRRILQESLKTLEQSITETDAIYKEGFIEELDVDRLRLLKNNLGTTLSTLEQQLVLAEKMLKFQMGYDVANPIELTDTFDAMLASASLGMESEPKFDFNETADSRLISSGLKLQELSRKRMMANYLPTLSTFYSWRENRVGDEFSMLSKADFRVTGGNILGVNLSVPLFQGFSQRSRVQQASLELKKIRVQQTQAMQGYSLQSAQALGEFRSALNTFNNSRESVALARKIRDKSAVKYREGVGSSIELMQAENELLNAQGNYISSATQLLNARVNLDKQLNKF